jgi:hypothetical protein
MLVMVPGRSAGVLLMLMRSMLIEEPG